jgi:hypothetical protein
VSAVSADKSHGVPRLYLLDAEIDGQVNDTVPAVGKVIHHMQDTHARRR